MLVIVVIVFTIAVIYLIKVLEGFRNVNEKEKELLKKENALLTKELEFIKKEKDEKLTLLSTELEDMKKIDKKTSTKKEESVLNHNQEPQEKQIKTNLEKNEFKEQVVEIIDNQEKREEKVKVDSIPIQERIENEKKDESQNEERLEVIHDQEPRGEKQILENFEKNEWKEEQIREVTIHNLETREEQKLKVDQIVEIIDNQEKREDKVKVESIAILIQEKTENEQTGESEKDEVFSNQGSILNKLDYELERLNNEEIQISKQEDKVLDEMNATNQNNICDEILKLREKLHNLEDRKKQPINDLVNQENNSQQIEEKGDTVPNEIKVDIEKKTEIIKEEKEDTISSEKNQEDGNQETLSSIVEEKELMNTDDNTKQTENNNTSPSSVSSYSFNFEEYHPIVIDNGSRLCKAGFSGDDAPKTVFSSVIGRLKQNQHNSVYNSGYDSGYRGQKGKYVGDEALSKRGLVTLKYPVEKGLIVDWDNIETIWHYTFYGELRVEPEDHAVLLTESMNNPKANREKTAQYMFETFNTPAMYLAKQTLLSLYHSGRTTGVVVDIGDGACQIVPFNESSEWNFASSKLDISGSKLTEYLTRLIYENRSHNFTTDAQKEIVREMKEKLVYTAKSYDDELGVEKPYELPDGQVIYLGMERFQCAEALFQPRLAGCYSPGIHEATYNSIRKCSTDNDDLFKVLLSNIVLCGGSSMLPGLNDRMMKEIVNLAPCRVKVITQNDHKYSAWLGGSLISSFSSFQNMWISQEEYNETGPSIVHRKCI